MDLNMMSLTGNCSHRLARNANGGHEFFLGRAKSAFYGRYFGMITAERQETSRSRGLFLLPDVEAVEKIHGLLGVRCGGEDGALVVLENGQPVRDVGCMVVTHFRREPKIRAEESAGKFGNQLLLSVAFITPVLAAKAAVES